MGEEGMWGQGISGEGERVVTVLQSGWSWRSQGVGLAGRHMFMRRQGGNGTRTIDRV